MSKSPRLSLPYILPQQSQKHVTANESFRRLDALVQLSVAATDIAIEPLSPAEGDAYILPAGATGASWRGGRCCGFPGRHVERLQPATGLARLC